MPSVLIRHCPAEESNQIAISSYSKNVGSFECQPWKSRDEVLHREFARAGYHRRIRPQ